jgi:uncharacterized protein YegJ (DUF2314 family)
MREIILAAALLAGFGVGVAEAQTGDRTVIERPGEPGIVNYESDDSAMNAAIELARSKLPYFWERMADSKRYERGFTLKVEFPVSSDDGTTGEHIWVDEVVRTETGFTGVLANEPNWMKGKRLGDAVTFTEDMISDWGFGSRGKMIGFYTLRVMLPDMPEEDRAAIEPRLGENPQ